MYTLDFFTRCFALSKSHMREAVAHFIPEISGRRGYLLNYLRIFNNGLSMHTSLFPDPHYLNLHCYYLKIHCHNHISTLTKVKLNYKINY